MGGATSSLGETLPTVCIIGGGVIGMHLAHSLDATGKFNTLVLEKRSFATWPLALHRAAVVSGWEAKAMAPYTAALKRGSVIQAEVERIDADGVHVVGGHAPIQADYTVICVGAKNPIHPNTSSLAEATRYYTALQNSIAKAKKIVVIGAGAVGIELAGEIAARYSGYAAKNITIVGRDPKIMPASNFSDKARKELLEKLTKAGVKFIGGKLAQVHDVSARPDGAAAAADTPGAAPQFARFGDLRVDLGPGEVFSVDAVFTCTGVQINSQIYRDYLGSAVSAGGRIQVNEFLQPVGLDQTARKVFAVGDCSDAEPLMMAYAGKLTADALTANLVRLVDNKPMKPYVKTSTLAALLPIGANSGVGFMGKVGKDPESGTVMGDFLSKLLKGKDLFTPDFLKQLESGKGFKERTAWLAKFLKVDEATASRYLATAARA